MNNKNNESRTMPISNCLLSPTSENSRGFSVWCVLAKVCVYLETIHNRDRFATL